MEFGLKWPSVFLRKRSLKMLNLSDLGQRSINDLDLGHKSSCTNEFDYMYTYIHLTISIVSWKSTA